MARRQPRIPPKTTGWPTGFLSQQKWSRRASKLKCPIPEFSSKRVARITKALACVAVGRREIIRERERGGEVAREQPEEQQVERHRERRALEPRAAHVRAVQVIRGVGGRRAPAAVVAPQHEGGRERAEPRPLRAERRHEHVQLAALVSAAQQQRVRDPVLRPRPDPSGWLSLAGYTGSLPTPFLPPTDLQRGYPRVVQVRHEQRGVVERVEPGARAR